MSIWVLLFAHWLVIVSLFQESMCYLFYIKFRQKSKYIYIYFNRIQSHNYIENLQEKDKPSSFNSGLGPINDKIIIRKRMGPTTFGNSLVSQNWKFRVSNRLPLFYISDSKKPPTKIHNFFIYIEPVLHFGINTFAGDCSTMFALMNSLPSQIWCKFLLTNSDKIPNVYTLIEFRVIVNWKLTTALIGFGIWFICSNLDHKESVSHMERISKFQKRNGCRLTQYLPNY